MVDSRSTSLVSPEEVQYALRSLPDWHVVEGAIERRFEFLDFAAALAFVNRVGALAETARHHPDIDIRWNQVKLSLSSHDAGGLTRRDLSLAAQIDQLL